MSALSPPMRGDCPGAQPRRHAGFTMVELLVVLLIVALATGMVSLSLRDRGQSNLDEEAARLTALLEGARAQARASGVAVRWEPAREGDAMPGDFRFVGLSNAQAMPTRWLHDGVRAEVVGARALALGPEPLIPAQRVVLQLEDRRTVIATDGLGPFQLVDEGLPP